MIVDANILLYAVDPLSPFHAPAAHWFTAALNGDQRIGLPWQTLAAFTRLSTHPRLFAEPLSTAEAMDFVHQWLDSPLTWVPPATQQTVSAFAELMLRHHVTGNLVTDAQLAALALEHGVPVVSGDSDFTRFPEVRWINPLAAEARGPA